MTRRKVLAIGLDGLEATLAERLMAEGRMPALAELRKRSARFLLDEGSARRAGLPWEHVVSGLSPEEAGRWVARRGRCDQAPASGPHRSCAPPEDRRAHLQRDSVPRGARPSNRGSRRAPFLRYHSHHRPIARG
jgi:hypothetical protein